jgi:hypothetical protein
MNELFDYESDSSIKTSILLQNVVRPPPLYGPSADRQESCKSGKPILHREHPLLKKSQLLMGRFLKNFKNCWRTLLQTKFTIPYHNLTQFSVGLSL